MRGIIVCPQPRAADVGADVLMDGGNAFDAAVATAFAQMAVDPFSCGLGGMGALTYFDAVTNSGYGCLSFHSRAGSKVTADMWATDFAGVTEISGYSLFADQRSELGYTSIMTPGTVAGLWAIHRRYGTTPWPRVVLPAADLARRGIVVTPTMLSPLTRQIQPGLPSGYERIRTTEACRMLYLDGRGTLPAEGSLLVNHDLAMTLDELAAGGEDAFYRGDIAQAMAADLERHGSYVTAADLANYRAIWSDPIMARYRGLDVYSSPPPSSGVCLVQMLQILQYFDLATMGHDTPEFINILCRVMMAAQIDRQQFLADPDHVPVPVTRFLSEARAAELARKVRDGTSFEIDMAAPEAGTTHVAVCDEGGNAITCTHTLGSSSGVVTPGLGFMYNNSMKLADPIPGRPGSLAPGKARTTGMAPTILATQGRPRIVVGAHGGSVMTTAIAQSILNSVDFGMSPIEAVSATRIHSEGRALHVEFKLPKWIVTRLEAMGHHVVQVPFSPLDSGRPYLISIDDAGAWRGGSDPRSDGGLVDTTSAHGL